MKKRQFFGNQMHYKKLKRDKKLLTGKKYNDQIKIANNKLIGVLQKYCPIKLTRLETITLARRVILRYEAQTTIQSGAIFEIEDEDNLTHTKNSVTAIKSELQKEDELDVDIIGL